MAVSELLRLVIDADTSGAVREIDKLGTATKRELSKSEQSIQKWGNRLSAVGAGMVALGAVGVAGLARAAQASEEANLSVVKLENTLRNMPQLAGESSDQFIDLADSIQDVTAADADQIVAAEAMLGTFRLTANQIKDLTPLVVDYARKFGVDLVTAATQVGKAVDGQVGALKRNGVSIDEAAFAADRFTAVQAALSEQVGGFAEAEGKTFAGSVQRLKNELGDLAEGVGTGAVDAFSSMFGVVDGLTDRLNELSPSTQNAIGKFATFGSVGLIAVGGLSILVGQTLTAVQNFKAAGAAISGFTTKLGGLRMAAGLAAGVTGVAAVGIAIDQMDRAQKRSNIEDLAREFLATGDAAEIAEGFMSENMDRVIEAAGAFDQLAQSDRQAAAQLITGAEAAGASDVVLAHMRNTLQEYSDAQDRAGVETEGATGAIEGQAGAVDDATSALQEYRDQMRALVDPVFAAMDAVTGVRDAQVALADAERGVLEAQLELDEAIKEHGRNSGEAAEAALGLEDAERALTDAQFGTVRSAAEADQALAGLKEAVDNGDVSMSDFQRTLRQWVDQGFLTEQQAAQAAFAVGGLAAQAEVADDKRVTIPVSTPGLFFAIGAFDQLAGRINSLPGRVRVSVGGGGGLILHEGGIVPGPRGQEVAAILQAGERVMSLQEVDAMNRGRFPGGAGGGTVFQDNRTINITTGADPQSVVSALRRASEIGLPITLRGRTL